MANETLEYLREAVAKDQLVDQCLGDALAAGAEPAALVAWLHRQAAELKATDAAANEATVVWLLFLASVLNARIALGLLERVQALSRTLGMHGPTGEEREPARAEAALTCCGGLAVEPEVAKALALLHGP